MANEVTNENHVYQNKNCFETTATIEHVTVVNPQDTVIEAETSLNDVTASAAKQHVNVNLLDIVIEEETSLNDVTTSPSNHANPSQRTDVLTVTPHGTTPVRNGNARWPCSSAMNGDATTTTATAAAAPYNGDILSHSLAEPDSLQNLATFSTVSDFKGIELYLEQPWEI